MSGLLEPSLPPRVSELEGKCYYRGLPSSPRLIARTGAPWYPPTGPEAYTRIRELRIPGEHELFDVWEDNLAIKVHDILNLNDVNWSSTEIVRIGYVDNPDSDGNLVLWIGVYSSPPRLSYDVGIQVAVQCKETLLSYGIKDVDVELRESDFVQPVGPALLKPTGFFKFVHPAAIAREPFITSVGTSICAENTPWAEGTLGFFIAVEGVDKLFGVTARHVLFPPSHVENREFERTDDSQPRRNVLLLSDTAFQQHLDVIQKEIDVLEDDIDFHQTYLERLAGQEDVYSQGMRKCTEDEKSRAEERKLHLTEFLKEIVPQWSSTKSRILGNVKFSPRIVVGAGNPEQQFTQDIAVFEVEPSKINPADFPGNFIDLGEKYSLSECIRLRGKMNPDPTSSLKFTSPINPEMRKPTMLDQDGRACITVMKRGKTTGLTLGRGLNYMAYVRKYLPDSDTAAVSKEWAVIPRDKQAGAFSAKGDSGAVVVDGMGRMAGMLTGGSGNADSSDVTYVTPIEFIMGVIRQCKDLTNAVIKNSHPSVVGGFGWST
ncbi:hypothetical protein BGW80DRAFT_1258334 [Lactifluus volemus]|nr:hypothetical protein BGW80DRAFT_1258334 [Lactifluus volemus]